MILQAKTRLMTTAAAGQAKNFRKALIGACSVALEGSSPELDQALNKAAQALKSDLAAVNVKCRIDKALGRRDAYDNNRFSHDVLIEGASKKDYGYISISFAFQSKEPSAISMSVEGGSDFNDDYEGPIRLAPLVKLANKLVDRFEKYGFNLAPE
jgi:hypothetical protein